jgi:NAD(P)-dependent dehydrogenase (short-subunit alcohol dehydrogenase family)
MTGAFSLLGRRAIVTGANSGIGRAIALGLARQGADVAVHGHGDRDGLESVRAEIGAIGRAAMDFEADFLDSSAPEALARQVANEFGPVDILIANAAIEHRTPWQDVTSDHLTRHFTANFTSLMTLCRALIPGMAERGWGRVVATGSVMAARPRAETVAYAAFKSAQLTAIRAIAREVAPRGVTMNVISPGAIETERMAARYTDASFRRAVAAKIPVGRPGLPDDCVGPAIFLCSNEAAYLTGVDIPVDGGWTIGDAPGSLPGEEVA